MLSKFQRLFASFPLLIAVLLSGCSDTDTTSKVDAYTIGCQAHIWGYPLVSNLNRFYVVSNSDIVQRIKVKNNTIPQAPVNNVCLLPDYVKSNHRTYLLPRILLRIKADLLNVLPPMSHIYIRPLCQINTAPNYIDYAAVPKATGPNETPDWTPDNTYWANLHQAIMEKEICPGEEQMVNSFVALLNSNDPAVQAQMNLALIEVNKTIVQTGAFQNLGDAAGNGWTILSIGGNFGTDYFKRPHRPAPSYITTCFRTLVTTTRPSAAMETCSTAPIFTPWSPCFLSRPSTTDLDGLSDNPAGYFLL
ncbi:MAG: hypothetical protein HQK56_00595 [Deltaproteobacteria bacterium]|nr:hypothetical protein [Deltaproteobacteria bacterium]